MFDGVDEVVFERREAVRRAVQGLLREGFVSPRTRVLLTSRPPGYAREAWSDDFLKCDVLPMTRDQRDRLIRSLFRAIYTDQDRAADKTRTLINSLNRSDERVQEMAQTPLLTTIFAKLQHNAYRLPDQRARVYKEAIDLILDEVYRKEDRFSAALEAGDSGQRLTRLSRIAFELQRAGVGEAGMIREDLIEKVSADASPPERPALAAWLRGFLHTMSKNACLIEETQENYFGFRSHRSFQEFLAGRYLAHEYAPYDLDRQAAFIRQVARSENRDQWEEPLRLAVGFLAIDAETRVEHFLSMLHGLSQQLDEQTEAGDWCRAVTALALFDLPAARSESLGSLKARIVESAFEVFVRPSSPLRDTLLAELGLALAQTRDPRLAQPLLEKLTANPPLIRRPAQRRAIGLALGAVGDPRLTPLSLPGRGVGGEGRLPSPETGEGSGVRVILPEMIPIPSGPFRMGTSPAEAEKLKAQNAEAWDDEKPQHTVFVSEFAIGKYPVTNAEFRAFVEAKGYEQEKYWSADGWRWRTGQLEADLSIYDEATRKSIGDWLARRPKRSGRKPRAFLPSPLQGQGKGVRVRCGSGPGATSGTQTSATHGKAISTPPPRWACTRTERIRTARWIWWATCGSGAPTGGQVTYTKSAWAKKCTTQLVPLLAQRACCAAARGTIIVGAPRAAPPTATGTIRRTSTTTSVFGWLALTFSV